MSSGMVVTLLCSVVMNCWRALNNLFNHLCTAVNINSTTYLVCACTSLASHLKHCIECVQSCAFCLNPQSFKTFVHT